MLVSEPVSDSRTSRTPPREREDDSRFCPECDRPEWCAEHVTCWAIDKPAFTGHEPGVEPAENPPEREEPHDGDIPF